MECEERQLALDLVGPQICMYRRYPATVAPYRLNSKQYVEQKRGYAGIYWTTGTTIIKTNTKNPMSKFHSWDSRYRAGGHEINLFPANKPGFDAAMKLLTEREVAEAYIGRLEYSIPDPLELRKWVFSQLELKAFKRIK